MPATNPYEQNDYQGVSTYRPYKLPINDIFKALTAQNQFWDEGARRVKNRYENTVNLKLLTTDNTAIRDQFVKDSEKEIQKMSSMDLSNPDIQRRGLSIFDPLYKDKDIVGEDYVVREAENELATGESFRTKDGGKFYNPLSIENLQYEKSLLLKDVGAGGFNKRDGWKTVRAIQSKYVPFSDKIKEAQGIRDLLTAEERQTAETEGNEWMIRTLMKKGVSADRIETAMHALGSPQFKAQLEVEAKNDFYKRLESDPVGIDKYYQDNAKSLYDEYITRNKIGIAEIELDNYIIGQTAANTPEQAELKKRKLEQNNDRIGKLKTSITSKEKDLADMLTRFTNMSDPNKLASNLGNAVLFNVTKTVHDLATQISYQNVNEKLEPNAAKIAKEKLDFEMTKAARAAEEARVGLQDIVTTNPTNETMDQVQKSVAEKAKSIKDELSNNQGVINDATIRTIMGDPALNVINQHLDKDSKVGDILQDYDLDSASDFIKQYLTIKNRDLELATMSASQVAIPGSTGGNPSQLIGKTTKEDITAIIKNWPISSFKKFMGTLATNSDDLITQLAAGNAKFADLKSNIRDLNIQHLNLSQHIGKQLKDKLGKYSKLFNFDKPLDDKEIYNGFIEGQKDGSSNSYFIETPTKGNVVIGGSTLTMGTSNPDNYDKTFITKDEYDKYQSGKLKLKNNQVLRISSDFETFKKTINALTDPVYANIATARNTNKTTVAFADKKSDAAKLTEVEGLLSKVVPSTDNLELNNEAIAWIRAHGSKVKGYNIFNPKVGESLPTISFIVESTSKEGSDDNKVAEKYTAVRFPITGMNQYIPLGKDLMKQRGMILAYDSYEGDSGKGDIKIVQDNSDVSKIVPKIMMTKGPMLLYYKDGTAVKTLKLTDIDIRNKFQQENGQSMDEVSNMEGGPTQVRKWLNAYINSINRENSKYKK